MGRLYISDLDGTLLRNDSRLSEFSRNGLTQLLLQGVNFTIASARSVIAMQKILGDLPLKLPIIEFNGSFISDFETGRHEVINSIGREITGDVYALLLERGFIPFLSTFDGRNDCLYYTTMANEGMNWYVSDRKKAEDRRLRHVTDLKPCLGDDVVCFTLIDRRESLEGIVREIESRFGDMVEMSLYENKYSLGWYWLTVHDRRASKDQAIRTLVDMLGLSTKDLTVFGDDVNDISMFRIAARAIAVGNAVEALKTHAHEVIGTNETDCVVRYILDSFDSFLPTH